MERPEVVNEAILGLLAQATETGRPEPRTA
jgi:hypothetical protein